MNRDELRATRSLVMETYWKYVKAGVPKIEARKLATSDVAKIIGCTPEYIGSEWSRDMVERRIEHIHNMPAIQPVPLKQFVADADIPAFYDDYQVDTPKERIFWLRDQLVGMKAGDARACLFDTQKEADECKHNVSKAAHNLGWKSNRRSPGFYAEILPVGSKFKLRVKRLR